MIFVKKFCLPKCLFNNRAEKIRNYAARYFVSLETFGACMHCKKTCISQDYFHKFCTISSLGYLPFWEILSNIIEVSSLQIVPF